MPCNLLRRTLCAADALPARSWTFRGATCAGCVRMACVCCCAWPAQRRRLLVPSRAWFRPAASKSSASRQQVARLGLYDAVAGGDPRGLVTASHWARFQAGHRQTLEAAGARERGDGRTGGRTAGERAGGAASYQCVRGRGACGRDGCVGERASDGDGTRVKSRRGERRQPAHGQGSATSSFKPEAVRAHCHVLAGEREWPELGCTPNIASRHSTVQIAARPRKSKPPAPFLALADAPLARCGSMRDSCHPSACHPSR